MEILGDRRRGSILRQERLAGAAGVDDLPRVEVRRRRRVHAMAADVGHIDIEVPGQFPLHREVPRLDVAILVI